MVNGTGQASINASGLMTAISNGTVTAKATAKDGSGIYGTLIITISNQVIPVSNITVTGAEGIVTIITDKGTLQLTAAILPSDATNKVVNWSVDDGTGKASISTSGLMTAIENGTVIARATATDGSGVYGTLQITISGQIVPVTGITIASADGVTTIAGEEGTLQLNAEVLPANATDKSVTWSIVNGTGQSTISSDGLVTAVSDGIITAIATANDGSGVADSLEIMVDRHIVLVEAIHITPVGVELPVIKEKNGHMQMEADIIPGDASVYTVDWSVENQSGLATVDNSGVVTAVANGSVKVIAKARDGSNQSGYCMVAIINQNPSTSLNNNINSAFYAVQLFDKLKIYTVNRDMEIDYCSLYSIHGFLLHQEKVADNIIEIDISSYPAGIYIVSLSNGQQAFPLKVAIH